MNGCTGAQLRWTRYPATRVARLGDPDVTDHAHLITIARYIYNLAESVT